MARITIQKCIEKVKNRFELVLIAAQRARDIVSGAKVTVERSKKEVMIALREIEEGLLDVNVLREEILQRYQKVQVEDDDTTDEEKEEDTLGVSFDGAIDLAETEEMVDHEDFDSGDLVEEETEEIEDEEDFEDEASFEDIEDEEELK